ncbi:type I-E CRISPR-associated protein Cse1/CasA [Bifidobacterium longum]|uniref:type I-E CRISPR-associated protein Cse1/CasA n=1 Tax=Bifidobacterium longum TaxID=216816 RepID=UPI00201D9A2F|nr:type I-E CRISPR-associated protein Cse1/CasA [Bifidobacterium longum]
MEEKHSAAEEVGASGSSAYACCPRCEQGIVAWSGTHPMCGDDGDFRPGIIRWLEEIRTEVLDSEEHVLNMVAIHAQGMTYGTQSSVFETGIDDKLSLNMVMFRHDYAGIAAVVDVVKSTDKAVTALTMFVRNLRSAAGDHSGKTQEIADRIRESAYADLDLLFRDRLANFDESQDPVMYSNAWLDEVHRLLLTMGRDYLSQSPVPVFEEHESGRFLKRTCNQG